MSAASVFENRSYDPKLGWDKLISVTFGTFPTYNEFESAFNTVCANGLFSFENDSFIGSDKLTCKQLWNEIIDIFETTEDSDITDNEREQAQSWCSSVMGILGWEWVLYVRHSIPNTQHGTR